MEKVIVIAGPTAAGKTDISVALAKQLNGEIISGDSMQIYKEMSIGTAKVEQAEMQGIAHYLIDELSYRDAYSVMEFQKRARAYMQQITKRGKIPIICGGTGLYIKACVYDYEFPNKEADEGFRKFLTACSQSQLYEMLKLVDPDACEKIHPHNRQRIIRALEIAHQGRKKSEIVNRQEHTLLYDVYMIGLTMERERLYERIDRRVDRMIEKGLYEEVQRLIEKEEDWQLQSMQGIGYKEWKRYFHKEASWEETVEDIKKNTRNFAKRQYTWFRNQLPMHWYDVDKETWKQDIIDDLQTFIASK